MQLQKSFKIVKLKAVKIIALATLFAFSFPLAGLLGNTSIAQVYSFEKKQNTDTVVFPSGTMFRGRLLDSLNSSKNKPGDKISYLIPADVKIGKETCIPKNSVVFGQVISSGKAKKGRNGYIQVKFEYIKFPDGWGTPLSAYIWNRGTDGIIGGEITKRTTYKKIPHYIEDIGEVAQLIETGDLAMGQEKFVAAGTECILVLQNDLEIKYLKIKE